MATVKLSLHIPAVLCSRWPRENNCVPNERWALLHLPTSCAAALLLWLNWLEMIPLKHINIVRCRCIIKMEWLGYYVKVGTILHTVSVCVCTEHSLHNAQYIVTILANIANATIKPKKLLCTFPTDAFAISSLAAFSLPFSQSAVHDAIVRVPVSRDEQIIHLMW